MPIQLPGYKPGTIEGIAKALEAVHNYYGIDTQKAQQKLLDAQTKLENQKVEMEKGRWSALQGWMGRNAPQQGGAPAPEGAAEPAAEGTPPQSPLLASTAPPATKSAPAAAPKNFITAEDLNNPILAPQLKPMLEAQKEAQGLEFAKNEDKRKTESHLEEISTNFNKYEPVIDSKNDIAGAQAVLKALQSGNKADIQLAKARLPLLALGIKRLGGEGESMADSKKLTDMLDEYMAIKSKGLPTTENVNMLIGAANRVQQSAGQRLDDLAENHAAQVAAARGMDKNYIKSKLVLPMGTQTRAGKNVKQSLSDEQRQAIITELKNKKVPLE